MQENRIKYIQNHTYNTLINARKLLQKIKDKETKEAAIKQFENYFYQVIKEIANNTSRNELAKYVTKLLFNKEKEG
ncbi:hypothetical protein [Muninn virus]|nr:hypothetical protein [Muninn virus]